MITNSIVMNVYIFLQGVELQLRRLDGLVQSIRENINYIKDRYVSFFPHTLSLEFMIVVERKIWTQESGDERSE